jgi:hypothetical protein
MADQNFPLWTKSKGIAGNNNLQRPMQEGQIVPGMYENLTTLSEPHLDPRAPTTAGDYGPPA